CSLLFRATLTPAPLLPQPATPTSATYTLSLHDALPISILIDEARTPLIISGPTEDDVRWYHEFAKIARTLTKDVDKKKTRRRRQDRKSTRLNSSHVSNSYAVFCLTKRAKAAAGASEREE